MSMFIVVQVLKRSLRPDCYIAMVACMSPAQADTRETLSTLGFCNEAKNLKTKPLPSLLAESCKKSAAKRKERVLGIPATPARNPSGNNSIHSGRPGLAQKPSAQRSLNATIGTPEKRARGEPLFQPVGMTSTARKRFGPAAAAADLSGISMIEDVVDVSSVPGAADITQQILSPLLRAVNANIQEQFAKFHSDVLRTQSKTFPKTPAKTPTKTPPPTKTPIRKALSRATSSPNRGTIFAVEDMNLDNSLQSTEIVFDEENIISGVGLEFGRSKGIGHRRRSSMDAASPELGGGRPRSPARRSYSSPPPSRAEPGSPSLEEMQRTLGINLDSPSLMFTTSKPKQDGGLTKSRKSSRLTTMMASELNDTLKEIQNFTGNRRRSVRVAAKTQAEEAGKSFNAEQARIPHPLLQDDNWKVDSLTQTRHNNKILDVINSGNAKMLSVSFCLV